ncbi:PstS family phosphate ABC transporter substrate-binding protein [Halioxenophilus sp. WMMB6]|uniref:PstS family phosphate ABC transporter substrate-binding protein n=1 Tax=Halioxenophilus sp. WMMB6 TaxID=3073815 RepID=UPI00295ED73F|nr:PstS family phosphate ABC transporter substrate-binding protein [Halioxenophilus sp. WMMB6]
MRRRLTSLFCTLLLAGFGATAQAARDYIEIVGSSTVYPFATVVAERFGRATHFRTPKIEATGSGGGFKLFCQGLGVAYPDITNASRRIKAGEVAQCFDNGVRDVVEVLIGYDGIVLGYDRRAPVLSLSRKELFLALAAEVPDESAPGRLIANPYQTWQQINPSLPNHKIEVLGPPPTSGTRDAFVELVMEAGCKEVAWLATLEHNHPQQFKGICHRVREDGAFIEAGENDNLIVQKLLANPKALGIFGYSFLDQNSDVIKGAAIDGQLPTFEAIADGSYPVSRPLYFYVKKAHIGVIPGIRGYLAEFTSNKAWGEEGYLSEKGMIPLSAGDRQRVATEVVQLRTLQVRDIEQ